MFDPRNNLANEVSAQLIMHFGDKVFRTIIPRNVRLAEAPSFGKPVLFHDKESRGALAYLALAGEMIRREEEEAIAAAVAETAWTPDGSAASPVRVPVGPARSSTARPRSARDLALTPPSRQPPSEHARRRLDGATRPRRSPQSPVSCVATIPRRAMIARHDAKETHARTRPR